MSDHRPECFYYMDDFGDGERCICDRLRACERRVLDAAREAVKAGCGWRPAGRCSECTHATAAIEALSDTMRPDAATQ